MRFPTSFFAWSCWIAGTLCATDLPTVKAPLPDIVTTQGNTIASIDLRNYFEITGIVGQVVQFRTNFGTINIEMLPASAPATVANFLTYVNGARYTNSFVHRSDKGLGVIQGGGYTLPTLARIATDPPIALEYNLPNTRGTIAMARLGVPETNTATSEWFINTDDNTIDLGAANGGGYAVFGRVTGTGMTVVDAVAALPTYVYGPFGQLPLNGYSGSGNPLVASFVIMNAAEAVPVFPASAGQNSVVGFSGTNSDPALVNATLNGSVLNLVLTPGLSGSATLTLVATDSNGNSIQNSFRVDVGPLPAIAIEQPAGSALATGDSRAFPAVNLGNSADLTFTVKNTGAGNLRFTGTPEVAVDGADASLFTVTAQPISPVGGSGGSTTFTVRFTPSTVGAKTAALHIASNVSGGGSPFDINISGTALPSANADLASLVPSAGTLSPAFASGTTSYAASVANTTTTMTVTPAVAQANAVVTVNGVTVASGTASGPIDLNLGTNTILTVVTAADGTTTKTYTLTVTRSGTPQIAVEQPAGTALVDGTTTDFAALALGASRDIGFTIRNTGTADLTGLGITLDGTDAGMFTSSALAPVIAPGSSTTFTIRFTPASAGPKTAALHIANNDIAAGPFDVTLTGTGVNDLAGPLLKLVSPASRRHVTGSEVVFSGTATDDTAVDRVEVVLNGGAPQVARNATPTKSFTWTLSTLPENGVNTAVVTAYDEFNVPSLPITRKFTFGRLRPEFAGSYLGLLAATTDSIDHEGLVKIDLTGTGSFTGWVKLGGVTIPLTGLVLNDGTFRFGRLRTPTLDLIRNAKPVNASLGQLELTLDLTNADGLITGTLSQGATAVAELAHADRALYNSRTNPAGNQGRYTALFNHGVAADEFPQGDGWAKATLAASGIMTIAGHLADGTVVSYAGPLSKANELPLYVPLYVPNRGFLSGRVAIDPALPNTDASAPAMKWFKLANPKDTRYPLGWNAGITVDFAASKFVPSSTNVLGLDLLAGGAVTLTLADGGTTGISQGAAVNTGNKITLTLPADPLLNLKATLVGSSGRLTGSFRHRGNNKTVSFGGVVYQKLHTAGGYFLYYPPKQAGQPTPSALSGSAGIAPQ